MADICPRSLLSAWSTRKETDVKLTPLRHADGRPLSDEDFSPVAGSEQLPDRRRASRVWPGIAGRGLMLRAGRLSRSDLAADSVDGVIFEPKSDN